MIWKLCTSIYGLCDAPRVWYLQVKEELLRIGVKKSKFDDDLFFLNLNGQLQGIICCHVDDFCLGETELFEEKIILTIKKEFIISHEENDNFKYLGLYIKQVDAIISLNQNSYINEVESIYVSREGMKKKEKYLCQKGVRQLRGIAGQLLWVAAQTRPDISFSACDVSMSLKDATIQDIFTANKVLKKLKSDKVTLFYPEIGKITDVKIIG